MATDSQTLSTIELTDADRAIIAEVEPALTRGVALKKWWEAKAKTGSFAERFDVIRNFNPSASSYGFADVADLPGLTLPVNGIADKMLYDNRKCSDPDHWRDEFRQFVLHYFLRVSDYRQPSAHTDRPTFTPPDYLQAISWCSQPESDLAGFGFSQHYYKMRDSGVVGKVPAHSLYRIPDLRDIAAHYEWLVLKVRIYSFAINLGLPGSAGAKVLVPLNEETYLVISPDFVVDRQAPAPGVVGQYGFGYAFVKNTQPSDFAFGPGEFTAAFEQIDFSLNEDGQVWVETAFVENKPDHILNLSINPLKIGFRIADFFSLGMASTVFSPIKMAIDKIPPAITGFDPVSWFVSTANSVTNGTAAEDLCISRGHLERMFLLQHYSQHYQMLVGSLLTWRSVADWLDRAHVPTWVIEGHGRPPA